MNNANTKHIKKYIKNLKKELPVSFQNRKEIIENIKNSIDSYFLEHPNLSYEDLEEEFGCPKELVSNLIAMEDTENIKQGMKINRNTKLIIICAVIIIIIAIFAGIKIHGSFANVVYTELATSEAEIIESSSDVNISSETP